MIASTSSSTRIIPTKAVRDCLRWDISFQDGLHLSSVGVEPGAKNKAFVVDHGKITDQEKRHVSMIEALAADAGGNVSMQGSWDVRRVEEATHQFFWPEFVQ